VNSRQHDHSRANLWILRRRRSACQSNWRRTAADLRALLSASMARESELEQGARAATSPTKARAANAQRECKMAASSGGATG
jgi:hypothetical protein